LQLEASEKERERERERKAAECRRCLYLKQTLKKIIFLSILTDGDALAIKKFNKYKNTMLWWW
jgi:hypothetical protein